MLGETLRLQRRALGLMRGSLPAAPVLAFAPHLLFAAVGAAVETLIPARPSALESYLWAAVLGVFTLAWLATAVFVLGVLVRLAEARSESRPFDPDSTLELVSARFVRLAVGITGYLLAVAAGLALLIVPGFVVAGRLLIFPQAILREYQQPGPALIRSWRGTKPPGPVVLALLPAVLLVLALGGLGIWLDLQGWSWGASLLYAVTAGTASLAFAFLGAAVYVRRLEADVQEAAEAEREAQARTPEGTFRYTCPNCERVYALPHLPPAGSLCPTCRQVTR